MSFFNYFPLHFRGCLSNLWHHILQTSQKMWCQLFLVVRSKNDDFGKIRGGFLGFSKSYLFEMGFVTKRLSGDGGVFLLRYTQSLYCKWKILGTRSISQRHSYCELFFRKQLIWMSVQSKMEMSSLKTRIWASTSLTEMHLVYVTLKCGEILRSGERCGAKSKFAHDSIRLKNSVWGVTKFCGLTFGLVCTVTCKYLLSQLRYPRKKSEMKS